MAEDRSPDTQSNLLRDTQRRREALRMAMTELERAIAAPVPGRTKDWSTTVSRALDTMSDALDEHVAANECADGLFDQVIESQPRLTHIVTRLRTDHVDMADAVDSMQEKLASAKTDDEATAEAVREAAVALVAQLVRHRHAGADLLYAAYSVDISAAD
jgi:hypothetical protein